MNIFQKILKFLFGNKKEVIESSNNKGINVNKLLKDENKSFSERIDIPEGLIYFTLNKNNYTINEYIGNGKFKTIKIIALPNILRVQYQIPCSELFEEIYKRKEQDNDWFNRFMFGKEQVPRIKFPKMILKKELNILREKVKIQLLTGIEFNYFEVLFKGDLKIPKELLNDESYKFN